MKVENIFLKKEFEWLETFFSTTFSTPQNLSFFFSLKHLIDLYVLCTLQSLVQIHLD